MFVSAALECPSLSLLPDSGTDKAPLSNTIAEWPDRASWSFVVVLSSAPEVEKPLSIIVVESRRFDRAGALKKGARILGRTKVNARLSARKASECWANFGKRATIAVTKGKNGRLRE